MGTPNLCAEPKQTSAAMCPGAFVRVKDKRSEATILTTSVFALSSYPKSLVKSCKIPLLSGV
jgi:hypothetical protein